MARIVWLAKNKYNPAPEKDVYWSEQSWDEMYCPFIAYSLDSEAPKGKPDQKTDGRKTGGRQ